MHRPTLALVLALALTCVSAAPTSPLRPTLNTLAERGIGEEAERRVWRRQLASSVNGIQWSLVETGSSTTAEPTSTSISSTESTTVTSTSMTETTSSESSTTSSSSPSSSSSSPSISISPTTSSSKSSTSQSSSLSFVPSTSSTQSAIHATTSPKVEATQSGNIFSPSNKLFAVGILVIIAIIVIAILLFIFVIKRVLHSSRFADPLDYPEGLPPHYDAEAISKRYSRSSQMGMLDPVQLSPNASVESYDSNEKGEMKPETSTTEFVSLGGGGYLASGRVPPSSALPPLPPARIQQPFSNFDTVSPTPTPRTRTRAGPPAPLSLPTSSFSAPAFDSAANLSRPPKAEKPLPSTLSSSFAPSPSSNSLRPSYVSTLPLSPNSPSSRFKPTATATLTTTSDRFTRLPPKPSQPQPTARRTAPASQFVPPHPAPSFSSSSSPLRSNPSPSKAVPPQATVPTTRNSSSRHSHSPPKGRESPLRETAFVREQSRRLPPRGAGGAGGGGGGKNGVPHTRVERF